VENLLKTETDHNCLETPMATADDLRDLVTIRDWLRYAVSRFNAADIAYGHGTDRALDEAAFLILSALSLDIDELDPWLEARLTLEERGRLAGLIDARVERRLPAPYLVGAAYIRGHRFKSDARAIVPRSFIGELLCDRIEEGEEHFPPLPAEGVISRVLDICTGGGSLAVLAAMAFPDAVIDAVDISPPALALARENVEAHRLGDRIRLLAGDLFQPVDGAQYDLIISNPPYVTDAAMDVFPPEHRAEPELAHRGGSDGLTVVRRLLADAGKHLAPGGQIVIEAGDARAAMEASFPDLPLVWVETRSSSGEVFALPASAIRSATAIAGRPAGRRRRV
jgi:ribosomal protein L3 glutamine methyltransferase